MSVKTMKCDEVRLLLVSFADGALAGARAEAVRTHVAGCAGCRDELAQLAADAEVLRRDEKPEVPAYLGTRITAGIRERQVRARPWFGLSRAMARLAAVALVAVGVWLGTALARGMVGPQQSPIDRLAQVGVELPNGEDK
ncbi:MAG: zf-HC2 domain-containing protein [candidate division WOR-3 bacterium]|nr:zf-HC2 domain-containing protein [candidate division WOR-3 bacterium]